MGLQRHLKVAGIFARLTCATASPSTWPTPRAFPLHPLHRQPLPPAGPQLLQLVDEIEGTTPVTGFAYGRM